MLQGYKYSLYIFTIKTNGEAQAYLRTSFLSAGADVITSKKQKQFLSSETISLTGLYNFIEHCALLRNYYWFYF